MDGREFEKRSNDFEEEKKKSSEEEERRRQAEDKVPILTSPDVSIDDESYQKISQIFLCNACS